MAGFGFVFDWMWIAIPGFIGIARTMLVRSFKYDTDYYIPVEEIKRYRSSGREGGLDGMHAHHPSDCA